MTWQAVAAVPSPASGNDGVAIFFHFGPGVGGEPAANITRWYSHFKEPRAALDATVEHLIVDGGTRHLFYRKAIGVAAARLSELALLAEANLGVRMVGLRALEQHVAAAIIGP